MTLSDDVNLEEFVMAKDELSGADIKAVCTEAGLLALRERRMRVTQVRAGAVAAGGASGGWCSRTPGNPRRPAPGALPFNLRDPAPTPPRPAPHYTQADFRKAKEKVLYKKKEGVPEGLYM
jgi:26S proteasome regulatory subunit T2